MTTTQEMVLIGLIVKDLSDSGSWCGETHIQKTAYIAKHVLDVPMESEFVLYKHGPYSFDLNKSLAHMKARGVLSLKANPGYGPSYSLNLAYWESLFKIVNISIEKFSDVINKACVALAKKNVGELERIATAFFVIKNYSDLNIDQMANKINELKPHLSVELSRSSLNEAKEIFV